MKQHNENVKAIDYRSRALRSSDRARTTKSNLLAIGAAITIILGFVVYALIGL